MFTHIFIYMYIFIFTHIYTHTHTEASLVAQRIKNSSIQETQFNHWVGKIHWRRVWKPILILWTEEPGRL